MQPLLSYNEFSIKTIQYYWDKFYAASVGLGTASQKNLYQYCLGI